MSNITISSIAIPPLGCGNSNLKWFEVKPIIIDHLSNLPYLDCIIYEPKY